MENLRITRTLHKNISWEEFQVLRQKNPEICMPAQTTQAEVQGEEEYNENPFLDMQILRKMLHSMDHRIAVSGKLYLYPDIPDKQRAIAVRAFGNAGMGRILALLDTSELGIANRGILFSENMLALCDGKYVHHIPYSEITGVRVGDKTVPAAHGTIVFRRAGGEYAVSMDGVDKSVLTEIMSRSLKRLQIR